VRSGGDPRGAVKVDADVALGGRCRLARVHADADADFGVFRPLVRDHRPLGCGGGCYGVVRVGEDDEEGVALGSELEAAVLAESRPEEPVVVGEDRRPFVTESLGEGSRALDVGEEEGNRACRQVHGRRLISGRDR
jgi:hypothetical protein